MTDTTIPGAHSAIRVLAALAELGETTAAAIAEHSGIAYSTTTPKLRTWENTGQAERFRTDDGRTLWRLTEAGRTATAIAEPHTAAQSAPVPGPVEQPKPTTDTATDTEAVLAAPPESTDTGTPADTVVGADDNAGARPKSNAGLPLVEGQPHPDIATDPGANSPQPDPADLPAVDVTDQEVQDTTTAPQPVVGVEVGKPNDEGTATPERRSPGSMRAAVLDICEAHPDRQYKVGELCRLIDAANAGTDAKKASQGAVYNACTKLAAAGTLTQTVDKPATFQLAPVSN